MKNNKNIVVFEQDGNKVIAKSFINEGNKSLFRIFR